MTKRIALPSDLDGFRVVVREWLSKHVPRRELASTDTAEGFEAHREWEEQLHAAGLAAIHWPEQFGGRGLGVLEVAAFEEEYVRSGAPERLNIVGLHICGPTIMEHGTEEQLRMWLPDILACRSIWSQGFSEPDAGSDLAAIRTRGAVLDDVVVLDGQKIWTSLGKWCDWILTLVRTDPDAPKHAGLSLIGVDRHTPGVDPRPIRQITGEEGFAEVFFDGVEVPRNNIIGPLNAGWDAAMRLLAHERGPGVGSPAKFERRIAQLLRIAEEQRMYRDQYWRQRIAQHVIDAQVYRWTWERDLQLRAEGDYPVELASINKLMWTQLDLDLAETTWGMLGDHAELARDAPLSAAYPGWLHDYWYSRAHQIAAGTTEINLNVVARRVLDLPRG